LYLFDQCAARFAVQRRFDRDQSHCGVTVAGQDDLVALPGSTNQFGQLPLASVTDIRIPFLRDRRGRV
jgi:hypothetical protein